MMRRWPTLAAVILAAACSPSPSPTTEPNAAAGSAAPSTLAGSPSASSSASGPSSEEPPPPPPPASPLPITAGGADAVKGKAGLVTSVEEHATKVGAAILKSGGNAIDAAVATAFALAVTHPSAGPIGGGGFMMVRLANGEVHAIDFREMGPTGATTEKMIENVEKGAYGYGATATPGSVAGLLAAADRFGTKPRKELLQPAIDLARDGHKLGLRQAQTLVWAWPKLKKDAEASRIFAKNGRPLGPGETLKQTDLANTLERVADLGKDGFYGGDTAKAIAAAMKKNGGYIDEDDLAAYEVVERKPLTFSYRGFTIHTMPPPSMGGIAVAEILMTMERVGAHEHTMGSAQGLHLFVEAARRAYSERRLVGADPAFYSDDVADDALAHLLSESRLQNRKPPIDPTAATPSKDVNPSVDIVHHESEETTHLSVVDAEGNAVSLTITLSAGFGAKVVVPKTGVLFSNALDAFSPEGENMLAAGKRMASSMCPTIVTRGDDVVLVVGSPGGDTIPNTVAQLIRNLIDYGMTVDAAALEGRVHHQWYPDRIRVEKGREPSPAVQDELRKMGHEIEVRASPLGDANIIVVEQPSGVAWGYADPREGGLALGVDNTDAP